MKNPHLKWKGKGKHLLWSQTSLPLLLLHFQDCKNWIYSLWKQSWHWNFIKIGQFKLRILNFYPTFTKYLPSKQPGCGFGAGGAEMGLSVCVWWAGRVSLCSPSPARQELQQEDTGSCKSPPAHCTNQPNSFQSAVNSFSFAANLLQPSKSQLDQFSVL